MRLIGTLPTESDAHRIGDHLLAVGMRNLVEPGRDGEWLLWVEHDDHVEQAQLQLRQFQANPNDPQYANAHAVARAARAELDRVAERRRRNFTDVRTSWAGLPARPTTITLVTAALCVVVFVLQNTEFAPAVYEWLLFYTPRDPRVQITREFLRQFGLAPGDAASDFTIRDAFAEISRGQLWRLFTPALMHANFGHILFNVWAFLSVGTMVESRKGHWVMLAIVLGGAVVSCCAQAVWDAVTPTGGVGFVGLSGVVYSVFGYAWIRGRLAPAERVGLAPQQTGLMLTWLLVCMTGLVGPIANAAHLVGLAVGVAVGYWPTLRRRIGAR